MRQAEPMSTLDRPSPDPSLPPPGGTRRFIVVAAIVLTVLVGSVAILFFAIAKTGRKDYQGPDKLVFPEHRYYR